MRQHWPRWIKSSIAKYFDDNKGTYTLKVEGDDVDTSKLDQWVELRIDGPKDRIPSKDYHVLTVEINLVMSVTVEDDLYAMERLTGHFENLFVNEISIFKYGDGVDDDDSLLFCIRQLVDDVGREAVQVSNFGQIRPDTFLMQSTVEGHYFTEIQL